MTNRKLSLATLALLVACSTAAVRGADLVPNPVANPNPVPQGIVGKIDSVTVYRGQALVTRAVDVPGGVGLQEVVVTGLPESTIGASVYAEPAGDGLEIRSVRFRDRAVPQDVREEVRKLDDQIVAVQDLVAANRRQVQVLAERKTFLDKLENFTAPTASAELTKGVLNAEILKTLTLFVFDQRQTLATDELKLAKDMQGLQLQFNLLQRQRNELAGGGARTVHEAVVFINEKNPGGHFRLGYLVNNANWAPSYNIRTGDDRKSVNVEYNAAVEQMSGEDWTDVAMTLSTATPSLVATAPKLGELTIALTGGGGGGGVPGGYFNAKQSLMARKSQAESMRNNADQFDQAAMPQQQAMNANANGGPMVAAKPSLDSDLNGVADELQVLELVAKDADRDAGARAAGRDEIESISVTYKMPGRTSLPSRADRQLIQIASLPMKADFFKIATPVLTSYVYDEASVSNEGGTVLLAGPASSYVGGQFVGAAVIPTVAAGESFTVGFGIDSSLRAGRELLDKTEVVQGGNKVLTFNYRLSVENFGDKPARVRLIDRVPTSKQTDVRITPISSTVVAVQEPAGPAQSRPKGQLRWDIDVPAQAMGAKASIVDHQFKVEYDKSMTVAGLPAAK